MNKKLRDKIKHTLAVHRMDTMFGDGIERDYIYEGATIIGLDEMDDYSLLLELLETFDEDYPDEFTIKCRKEFLTLEMKHRKANSLSPRANINDEEALLLLIQRAEVAYWAVIAARFPNIPGDFPPDAMQRREDRNLVDLQLWLNINS